MSYICTKFDSGYAEHYTGFTYYLTSVNFFCQLVI